MQFFLDTADIAEIKEAMEWGILDGVTTNPTHVSKTGRSFREVLEEILQLGLGAISAEVTAVDTPGMLREARALAALDPHIVVKIPLIGAGLPAIKTLTGEGIKVNVTLCFSSVQALLAAKAGATYISPFVGRVDEIGHDGMEVVREIRQILDNYGFASKIITSSIRSPNHVREAALAGSDVSTMPMEIYRKLVHHPLTDIGLDKFLQDWKKIPEELRKI